MEDQTAFCASCNAPLIKVAVPASSEPSSPPLSPGTPDSVEPPAVPLNLQARAIDWKRYSRFAVPLSILASLAIAFITPIGLLIFFGVIIYCVNRYCREHGGRLSPSHGARLGAFNGLITFLTITVLVTVLSHGEFRQQMVSAMQQKYAASPDPRVQQVLQWAATTHGFVIFMTFSVLFLLVIFLVVSSFAGAITVTLSGNKRNQ